ncbi:MAG TPA: hypothetical protein VLG44_01620 [Chlamydiales bacterium]|nr:hypothetical protein [Chlamydiales bacterium]
MSVLFEKLGGMLSNARDTLSEMADMPGDAARGLADKAKEMGSRVKSSVDSLMKSQAPTPARAQSREPSQQRKPSSAAQSTPARVITREPSPARKGSADSVDGFDVIEADSGSAYGPGFGRPWERAKYLEEHPELQPQTSKMEKVDIEIDEEIFAPVEPLKAEPKKIPVEIDIRYQTFPHWALEDSKFASEELSKKEAFGEQIEVGERQGLIKELNSRGFNLSVDASFIQIADEVHKKRIHLECSSPDLTNICALINERNKYLRQKTYSLHQYYSYWDHPEKDNIKIPDAPNRTLDLTSASKSSHRDIEAAKPASEPAPRKLTSITSSVSFHPGSFQRF